MKTNVLRPKPPVYTHGGAVARQITPIQQLRRSVCSCFLWEDEFYESGESIYKRIVDLIKVCKPTDVAALAIEAREQFHLRHVPLLLVRELARHPNLKDHPKLVSQTLARVIQRADELSEFLAIYWKGQHPDKRDPLSKQVKRGLAWAIGKFDEYQLAKYDRAADVRLRDVLFLTHARPREPGNVVEVLKKNRLRTDDSESTLWRKLAQNELKTPDTWEVGLSAGADKKETFERLLREGNLGYSALIKNLRNMEKAGVDNDLIREAVLARKNGAWRVLPFRFFMAAKHAPRFEDVLDQAMVAGLQNHKLPGKTVAIIDVSGSMNGSIVSKNSDMSRMYAACALAAILRDACEQPVIYATAGNDHTRVHKTALIPARRGISLADAVAHMCAPLGGGGIFLKQVMDYVGARENDVDRTIVITDEQDCAVAPEDKPANAKLFSPMNYMINVASAKNGIGYGPWVHIDGWSEAVIRYISEYEKAEQ